MDAQALKMFEASFLSKATRKSEVISRMGELHGVLRDMPQLEPTERPAGFEKTAAQLISQRILGNSDKDVRLLACCCIVDMFRVSAPDIPFSDDECVKIFDAFVAQLRGLSTCDPATATGQKIIYILHSLATVNTCVLPVILSHNGVSGAAEIVISMFQVLIQSVHQDHDEEGECGFSCCLSSFLLPLFSSFANIIITITNTIIIIVIIIPLLPCSTLFVQ
jgi:sister-chromatid-cohesion protein PDS5